MRPTGQTLVDFAFSLVLIVAAAMLLNGAGNRLVAWIFAPRPAKAPAHIAQDDEETLPNAG